MPTSHVQIIVHIIFGTKGRFKCLNDTIHPYIAGIIKNANGLPIMINGTEDHVHILAYLPKDLSIAVFVQKIKSGSSKWFPDPLMKWQVGYAAFSVSATRTDKVKEYIQNQKEHHRKQDFAEEMKKYLDETGGNDVWGEWFTGIEYKEEE
jgi:putative transposase